MNVNFQLSTAARAQAHKRYAGHILTSTDSGILVPTYDLLHFVAGIAGIISPEAGQRLAKDGFEINDGLKNEPLALQIGRVLLSPASTPIGISNPHLLKTA